MAPRSRPRRPRWSPWPSPGSGPQAPELDRRPSTGSWPTARGSAGSRTRPRGRRSPRWPPSTARPGPPRTAIDLVVTVNDAEVYRADVAGAAEGKAVLVPPQGAQGRATRTASGSTSRAAGTFGYAVTLTGFTRDFGPDQNRANRTAVDPPPGLPPGRPRARRQDPADRLRRRGQPARTFENKVTPGRARRPGAGRDRRLPRSTRRTSPTGSATSSWSRSTCPPARR